METNSVVKKYFWDLYQKIKIINLSKFLKISLALIPLIIGIYFIDYIFEFNKYLNLILQIFICVTLYFLSLKLLKLDEFQLLYKNRFFN